MADNYMEACRSQLLIDSSTVRNVRNIRWNKTVSLREFGTSTTSCSSVNVKGRKNSTVDFDVVLSDEEMIYDVIDVGDEVTLAYQYYDNAGTLKATRTIPVIIESMSDEHNIDEGGEIMCSVTAKSNGAETYA